MNGTNQIVFRKATVASHGTDTGWQAAFAQQAEMPHFFLNNGSGFITIDGSYRYGFLINLPSTAGTGPLGAITLVGPAAIPNVTIKNTAIICPDADGKVNYAGWNNGNNIWGIDVCPSVSDASNLVISGCKISGFICTICLTHCHYALIESNELAWAQGSSLNHSDISLAQSSDYVTLRYNYIHDFNSENFEIFNGGNNWQVYENIVRGGDYTTGSTARFLEFYAQTSVYNRSDYRNYQVYNNTLLNLPMTGFYVMSGSGGYASADVTGITVTNNLYYGVTYPGVAGDYNWFSGANTFGEPHSIAGGINPPFVGASYSIVTNQNPAGNVFAPYTGNNYYGDLAKGAYLYLNCIGTNYTLKAPPWTIGAYRNGGPLTNPAISINPASYNFGILPSGQRAVASFLVQNVGGGTLSGSASVSPPFQVVSGSPYNVASNSATTVQIAYDPAAINDQATVNFTGGGGASARVSGAVVYVQPGLAFASTNGTISGPLSINGDFISQPVETDASGGGQAIYFFNVVTAGDYVISAVVNAPNTGANSIYVNIDSPVSEPMTVWDIPVTTNFQRSVVAWRGNGTPDVDQFTPKVFTLAAGQHQLIIVGREANTQLGQITIQSAGPPPSPPHNFRIQNTSISSASL